MCLYGDFGTRIAFPGNIDRRHVKHRSVSAQIIVDGRRRCGDGRYEGGVVSLHPIDLIRGDKITRWIWVPRQRYSSGF